MQRALLALSLQPSTQRYLEVAAAYREAGVRDKAFDYLSEGVRRDPDDAALHDALARAWRDWGFPERGLTAAHRAVYYAPQSAEARNTLGTVLWSLGQRTEARQAFQQAADLNPLAWYAWRNLCEAAMSEGRTKDAIDAVPAGDGAPQGGCGGRTMRTESIGRRRTVMPPAPRTLDEAGLSFDGVMQLVVKLLHLAGELSGAELGERLGLRYSVLEPVLHHLRTSYLCEVSGGGLVGGPSFVYRVTDAGRTRAMLFLEHNRYVGVAPVPFRQYERYMRSFDEQVSRSVTRAQVQHALSHLVLSDRVHRSARPGRQRRPLAVRLRPPGQRQDGHRAGRQEPARRRHRRAARGRAGRPPRAGLRPGHPRDPAAARLRRPRHRRPAGRALAALPPARWSPSAAS